MSRLKTEDTGKMFEMGICLAYGIEYDGKYKYSLELPEKLKPRLSALTELFPMCRHSAKKGARYDYTAILENTEVHLSAKSTKKGIGKVAPQVIGQSQPSKFCEIIGIEYTTIPNLKNYIQLHIEKVLPFLEEYTFDCPNLYYHQENDTIHFIVLESKIDWTKYKYTWTRKYDEWENSSTLKIIHNGKEIPLVEFQFHTKSRTNMAVRWVYENFLLVFRDKLFIANL